MSPEYTQPFREVRWIWNNPNQISIVQNGLAQYYVRIEDIPLCHLKELSKKFRKGYIKIPYFLNGNKVQIYFDDATKRIFIEGEIQDRRKIGYLHPLIIELKEWDNAIKKIEEVN